MEYIVDLARATKQVPAKYDPYDSTCFDWGDSPKMDIVPKYTVAEIIDLAAAYRKKLEEYNWIEMEHNKIKEVVENKSNSRMKGF